MADERTPFGVVLIGRNEGDRLKRCLSSIAHAAQVVYVDSGSSDGSLERARQAGSDVVELDLARPFTAARARNAGLRRLREIARDLEFVQFVDGDCELKADWPNSALHFLRTQEHVCAVFGRRRERYPGCSIYNLMCDHEWDVPIGEAKAFGGDVMIRVSAFEAVAGFREELIAGEEPELCVRLRAAGWKIWRIDHEMTLHDAAIKHFSQWWRRQLRSGYAFAQGAYLHGREPERHWVWESLRAALWGIAFPISFFYVWIMLGWWGCLLLLVYPLQILRRMTKMSGSWHARLQFACFEQLSRFAEAIGLLRFMRDRLLGWRVRLVEYK